MVRVISVHHFASQHIQTVEQPTASTIASPNRLLLALSSHCIEVRDLTSESDILFTFPTVDQVTQLLHCLNGDFVLTVETKFNRQNRETNYVRVYVNWDSVATLQQSKMTSSGVSLESSECGMVQPMRARIAGRVTPTTNQSELGSLEMIEIPVMQNPTTVACCGMSGNVLVQAGNILSLYAFQIKTHDISKLKFIDFEEMPFLVQLNFAPLQVRFAENYVACLKDDSVYMFRICNEITKTDHDQDDNESDIISRVSGNQTIDYGELLQRETLHSKKNITVNLPSIVKNNSLIHRHSPFTFIDKEMNAVLKNRTLEDRVSSLRIESLVQLKLKPILIENAQSQINEEFKSLILKPLYIDNNLQKNSCTLLKSTFRKNLSAVVCFIATQQEGYMYLVPDDECTNDTDYCISVYPFTAPVIKVVLENNLLHALTDTGLETYTVRIGHKLCRNINVIDNVNVACPSIEDSICLVNLRPFLGVEQILLSENHLILMASSDNSPTHSIGSSGSSTPSAWTLYTLELPTPKTIFNDIAIVANNHRFSSPQTYCHLISEAHMILRLSLLLIRWTTIEGVTPAKRNSEDLNLIEIYRNSCGLLADHYIMCNNNYDYELAIPYYKMAGLKPFDVLKRVKDIHLISNNQATKGLLNYLKVVLSDLKFRTEIDMFLKASWTQNFVDEVLTIFENHNVAEIPNLVLKNPILREYSTTRFINILLNQRYDDRLKETERLLALTVLYLQRGDNRRAREISQMIDDKERMREILIDNWDLLFDSSSVTGKGKSNSFSELSILFMSVQSSMLADLFVTLIEKKKVTLNRILKIFLEYLPSRIGTDGNSVSAVLQELLELYFKSYFERYEIKELPKIAYDRASHEAIKILVRLYFSQLQMLQVKESNSKETRHEKDDIDPQNYILSEENEPSETFKYNQLNRTQFADRKIGKPRDCYLFASLRYEYLERMPPFRIEITSKLYEACVKDYVPKPNNSTNETADFLLMKLQGMLCSQAVPKQVIVEADAFLNLNEHLRGRASLRSILMDVDDSLTFLAEECPQCLLQFGRDRFTSPDQWKLLVSTVQRKIVELSQEIDTKRICFFYKKILKDILTYMSTTTDLDLLRRVLPSPGTGNHEIWQEISDYEPYLIICKETMHANQIKKLINATGQQLLATLNM